MGNMSYTSSRGYAVFIPLALGCLVVLCFLGAAKLLVTDGDWRSALNFALLDSLLAWAFWATWDKFAVVTVDANGVVVNKDGQEQRFKWDEVRSFWTVPLVTPAVHRLAFSTNRRVVYFVPRVSASLSIGFWTFHFSGMGRFIQQQLSGGATT